MWITFGSVHDVRAFRERKKRSVWFRELVENCVAIDKGSFPDLIEIDAASNRGIDDIRSISCLLYTSPSPRDCS